MSMSSSTSPQPELRIEAIPGWLELPPTSSVEPPVVATSADLPINALVWSDFERLCLQMARRQSDVVGARLYGTPGQEQEGIDLYARIGGADVYRVYQCKRVTKFEPSVIRDAVHDFLS